MIIYNGEFKLIKSTRKWLDHDNEADEQELRYNLIESRRISFATTKSNGAAINFSQGWEPDWRSRYKNTFERDQRVWGNYSQNSLG